MRDDVMHTNNTDKAVWMLIDLMLIMLASSTVAYEIVLFSRLPLWTCYPFFMVVIAVLLFYWIRSSAIKDIKIDKPLIGVLFLGLLCSLINFFINRPDADDFSYFHRAVYGLLNLDEPIAIFHTAHDIKNLPAISPVHLTSSIEVMTALLAHALGIQPVFFYQIINGSLFLFLLPLVYYIFFRHLNFSYMSSYIGSIIVLVLYIFSGDSYQDFGNFSIVRSWSGKCVLIMLLIPLASLVTYRFMKDSALRELFRLYLIAIAGIGFSGSAFFLVPFVIASFAISSVVVAWREPMYFKNLTWLITTLIPFAIIAGLIKIGLLPAVSNTEVWNVDFFRVADSVWRPEIISLSETVFFKTTTLYFYIIAVLGLLFFHWENKKIRVVSIASLLISCSLILPPVSTILINITLPAVYWRLAYTTQMLFVIAILVLLCLQPTTKYTELRRMVFRLLGVSLLGCFVVLKSPALKPALFAYPPQLKFDSSDMTVVNLLESWASIDGVALIPEKIVPAFGLLNPKIGLISTRELETRHVFLNAEHENSKNEGERRVTAQKELDSCGQGGTVAQLVAELPKLTILVFPLACNSSMIENNVKINRSNWMIKSTQTYQVWLKHAK